MVKRKVFLGLIALVAGVFVLGGLSIWPFTKVYTPLLMYLHWQKTHKTYPLNQACLDELKVLGVRFKTHTPESEHLARGCVVDNAVVVYAGLFPYINTSFQNLGQVTLSCSMAVKVESFVRKIPQLAKDILNAEIKSILHQGGYSCRNQVSSSSLMSSHAYAEAIDLTGFEFENHPTITVRTNFLGEDQSAQFLKTVAQMACKEFGTVIGPGYDDFHQDHLHIATGFPKRCVF
jgi:hypothetical protein